MFNGIKFPKMMLSKKSDDKNFPAEIEKLFWKQVDQDGGFILRRN